MKTQEVANMLVGYCREGKFEEAMTELYGHNIVSIEPKGAPVERIEGIEGVVEKSKQFAEMIEEYHGMEVSDPIVAENHFSCTMKMDVTYKGGERNSMEEICVYEVDNGKIVKEQFFYPVQPVTA